MPIEIYEVFEKGFGKEDVKKVVKSLEAVIEAESVNKWHQTKNEIIESLAIKDEFRSLRAEAATKTDLDILRTELLGKIEAEVLRLENKMASLDRKFTIMFMVPLFAIVFLNQNALEFIARVFGLIK